MELVCFGLRLVQVQADLQTEFKQREQTVLQEIVFN